MPQFREVIAANRPVFTKLLAFSLFMFASSLGTFFTFRSASVACACAGPPIPRALFPSDPPPPQVFHLAAFFTDAPKNYDLVGLVACVFVVNACIALYVWMAFSEEDGKED